MVSGCPYTAWRRAVVVAGLVLAGVAAGTVPAAARQLGALVSPGALSAPHASLEGIRNCQKCHEAGNRVTGAKCLSCHQPIAERIKARRGVHRAVQGGDCVTCHAEHQGASGELRPFDTAQFDHGRDASYPLDGRHAPLAARCASCHKTRSYLAVSTACASCHQDVHKGTLGATCETCHSTQAAFKDVRQGFDHSRAAFPLEGAHARVVCESCHKDQQYKGVAFGACTACHRDPHTPKAAEACTACHTPASWRTRRFDHATTKFALLGKHQTVACAACHVRPALQVTPKSDTCAACHTDPHKGAFKQDCKACHNEQSFAKAPFDHTTTAFPLTGKHGPAACTACHTTLARVAQRTGRATVPATVDFGGLKRECASCHDDVHAAELGAACETCHTTERFAVPSYPPHGLHLLRRRACAGHLHFVSPACGPGARARADPGAHGPAPVPPSPTVPATNRATPVHGSLAGTKFTAAVQACATCHSDVHLGQVAAACESCHAVAAPKFGVTTAFSHARATFPLGGRHATVECRKCHASQTGMFPTGPGTAVRLTGLATTCVSCHADVHLGQLGPACETCHTDQAFKLTSYTHRNPVQRAFFAGAHARAACSTCHAPASGTFPGGKGTAVRYAITTECTACHRDVHNGALGPKCADCHKFDRMARLAPLSDVFAARRAGR
ncbi:MAG: cytochrome c3 family protein [Vicinamibacterales bacterium]